MNALACDLEGADILLPGEGLAAARLSLAGGLIVEGPVGRAVDLRGFIVLPGIVDAHGGGIRIASKGKGMGTDFTISLPHS